MTVPANNPTSELDKQWKVIESGEADTLTRFFDWLLERGYTIGSWESVESLNFDSSYDEFQPLRIQPEQLFADFFGIDLDRIEVERRALLDALREGQ